MMGADNYSGGKPSVAMREPTIAGMPIVHLPTYRMVAGRLLMLARYGATTNVTCFAVKAMGICIVSCIEAIFFPIFFSN